MEDQFDNPDEVADEFEEDEDWTDTSWALPTGHHFIEPSVVGSSKLKTLIVKQKPDMTIKDTPPEDPSVIKRMLLNDNKAGMEGLDKQKINQIIHEASKGSRFYENERKKEEEMTRKIKEQKQKIELISESQLKQGLLEADMLLEDFEKQRDLSRTIVHIDMDAFYAAVEMRDNPSLRNKPMAVGGTDMLSTSNYHARKFGVRAAMPGFIGKKLCPNLIIVSLNFNKYTEVSKQVKALIAEYDPNFCPMSLDEAYLDITEHLIIRKEMSEAERTFICRNEKFLDLEDFCLCDLNDVLTQCRDTPIVVKGDKTVTVETYFNGSTDEKEASAQSDKPSSSLSPLCPICERRFPLFSHVTFGLSDEEVVRELRTRIEQKTRLTASAGIAPNMMLSKVCSDKNKPNGQYKIPATREAVMDFIKDLPTRKISGIGKVSESMLNAVGVYTCTDLYDKRALLYHLYSQISFNYFMRICLGIGSTTVERDSERKSISTERTFQEINQPADLYKKCEELADSLVEDLKEEQLKGKTVSIKIKTVKFAVKTRAHSLPNYTNDRGVILQTAVDLLKTEIHACSPQPLRLRLMGIRMSNLLNLSACKDVKKQSTILGAFKKLSEKSKTTETPAGATLLSEDLDMKERNNNHRAPILLFGEGNVSSSCVSKVEETNDRIVKQDVDITPVSMRDGSECEEMNNNKLTEQTKHHFENQINKMSDVVLKHANDLTEMEESCTEKLAVGQTEIELDSSQSKNGVVKVDDSLRSEVEIKDPHTSSINETMESVNDMKHPIMNETSHDNIQGEETYTLTTGKDVLIVRHVPDIERNHGNKEGREGNRSGLIRSNKKPPRKRKKSKQNKTVIYSCPICTKEIRCDSLNDFNEHVDECLEGSSGVSCSLDNNTINNERTNNSHEELITPIGYKSEMSTASIGGSNIETLSGDESSKKHTINLQETKNDLHDPKDCKSKRLIGDSITYINSNTKHGRVTSIDCTSSQLECFDSKNKSSISDTNTTDCHKACTNTQGINSDFDDSLDVINVIRTGVNSDIMLVNDGEAVGGKDSLNIKETEEDNVEHDKEKDERHSKETGIEMSPPLPSLPEGLETGSNLEIFDNAQLCDARNHNNIVYEQSVDILKYDNKNETPNNNIKQMPNEKTDCLETETKTNVNPCSSVCNNAVNDQPSKSNGNNHENSENFENLSLTMDMVRDTFPRFSGQIDKSREPRPGCSWMPDRIDAAADVNYAANDTNNITLTNEGSAEEHVDVHKANDATDQDKAGDHVYVDKTDDATFTNRGNEAFHSDVGLWEHADVDGANDVNPTDDGNTGDHSGVGLLVCPVCNVEQRSADLNEFNYHVDSCLSKGAITEILKEQKQMNGGRTFKRERDTLKTPGSLPQAKKRKTVLPNKSPSCKTILSFFKDSQKNEND